MTSSNATLALALRDTPQAVVLSSAQIQVIANTEFVPKSMRGDVPKVLACIARGRAMGIPDMVAINGIDIIQGKATLSAELMVAIVRAHGHSITGDVSATAAKVTGRRRDNGDTMTAEFNMEMAKAAGLLGKENWKKHPDDMMWARAVSKLCRRLFADCFAGGTYTDEDFTEGPEVTADETHDEPLPVDLEVTDEQIAEGEWSDGTVPEPDGQTGQPLPPDRKREHASGSATALDLLVDWCKTEGVEKEALVHARDRHYPSRVWKSLTDDEVAVLRADLDGTLPAVMERFFPNQEPRDLSPDELGVLHAELAKGLQEQLAVEA